MVSEGKWKFSRSFPSVRFAVLTVYQSVEPGVEPR